MPKPSKTVAVIGGGIGGMAVANILAKAGYKVTVYEARHQLGGRAGQFTAKGFTFDTGPSWYLMPEVFEHYFDLLDEDVNQHLNLTRLDPAYQVFFEDQQPVTVRSNLTQNRQLFEKLEPGAGQHLDAYVRDAEQTYELAKRYFLYNPFTTTRSIIKAEVGKQAIRFSQLATRSLHRYVSKFFKSQPLQQLLEYPTVFLGASPYNAPAIFSLMSYLDFKQGVFYPQGGLYEIIKSLETIGRRLGVQYKLNTPVKKITTTDGVATGLELGNGQRVTADLVISNSDLHHTETAMLPPALRSYPERYWQKQTNGPSALLLYLGVRGRVPQLRHHNLFFIKDWRDNFEAIFKDQRWPEPASLYVSMPSASDPSVAPKGDENLFVLVPAPPNPRVSRRQLEQLAQVYIEQIAQSANIPDLAERIIYQKIYGPGDFASDYFAWQGTALGPAHTLRQSAFFRPANQSKKVRNLYYVGAATQPGIGLPMCLISAELVYKRLIGDHSAGPLEQL